MANRAPTILGCGLGYQSSQIGGEVAVTEPVERDQQLHSGIAQQPVELVAAGPGAERDHHRTDNCRAKECLEPFDAIVHQQSDQIAARNAASPQRSGETGRTPREFAIRDNPAIADDRGPLAMTLRLFEQ
jgi:hypothetical protein